MRKPVRTMSALLVMFAAVTLQSPIAFADAFCDGWAAYMWDFTKQNESSVDSTWGELSAMKQRLSKGRRLAAVGSVSRAEPAPFPGIPSAVEVELDPATQAKVRTLYEKYVLLQRRIEDMWRDKYRNTESSTSMHRFAVERDSLVEEMNRVAKMGKAELTRYGLRIRDCFPAYESYAQHEVQGLTQALTSATSALKVNEGVWAHAYGKDEKESAMEPSTVSPRSPAAVKPVDAPEVPPASR